MATVVQSPLVARETDRDKKRHKVGDLGTKLGREFTAVR